MAAPLAGVRILDFTSGVAGPLACMLLADYGADVVRVEPPGGDPGRGTPGYVCWNRNKERVVLDVHRAEGLGTARALLAQADAAVFGSRPGELERLGLDAVSVRAANPGLLHVWLPPTGTEGRWSQLSGDDALLSAVSGVSWMQLSYEDRPVYMVTPQASYGQGMIAACAIAAGLLARRRTGVGAALRVSGLNGVGAVQPHGYTTSAGMTRLSRNSRGGSAHYSLYPCGDGQWLFLGCLTGQFFLRALDVLDLYDVLTVEGVEGDFTNLLRLPEAAARAVALLEARFAEKPRDDWIAILRAAGVPCAPAGDREEWFRGETVAANEMRVVVSDPILGPVEMPGLNVKLAATPGAITGLMRDGDAESVLARWPARPPSPVQENVPVSHCPAQPLAGVRVLDLGAFIAGTFAPTVLANLGADVIKIEPLEGDAFRTYGLMFVGNNQGKRSLALDLKTETGKAAFLDLVRGADVVLDNYRLGVRERLGIDYASLAAINPRIITCSVTGYGPSGPLAANPGFDPLLQAESGMMMAQGGGAEPVFYQIAVNDTATAIMAAFGMVLALHAREATSRGQEVSTCLANQTILCQSGELTTWPGAPAPPIGGRDFLGPTALRRFYATLDGWLLLACAEPLHFHHAAVALGHPEWAGRTTAERALEESSGGWLAEAIGAALAERTTADALDQLTTAGVPAAPALSPQALHSDPWLRANDFWWDFEHPDFGPVTGPRSYGTWDGVASVFPRRAPFIGEHSAAVLAEFGFDSERVAALVACGAVR